jgi:hypothetical protein
MSQLHPCLTELPLQVRPSIPHADVTASFLLD